MEWSLDAGKEVAEREMCQLELLQENGGALEWMEWRKANFLW